MTQEEQTDVTYSDEPNETLTYGAGPNAIIVHVWDRGNRHWVADVEAASSGLIATFKGACRHEAKRGALRYLHRLRKWLEPLDSEKL